MDRRTFTLAAPGATVPRGTPRAIVERMNRELTRVLESADIRQRFDTYGAESLVGSTPEAAEAFGTAQRARWIPAVKAMTIKVE